MGSVGRDVAVVNRVLRFFEEDVEVTVKLPPDRGVQRQSDTGYMRIGAGLQAKVRRCVTGLAAMMTFAALHGVAQAPAPGLDNFHWIDFRNDKDAPTVTWVTQALKAEHWTAIREIGVQWDSAVVVTTERKDPQATPDTDAFTIWSVSLAKHDVQPLLHGVNLRLLNWTNFGGVYQRAPELAIAYNDCTGCDAPSLFFTTIYYNL